MAREKFITWVGVVLGLTVSALVAVILFGWLRQPSATTTQADEAASTPSGRGWEIRYNATVALARRGSARTPERFNVLAEMLDEGTQLRNFRTRLQDGHDVADVSGARSTILNALKAIAEFHRRRPDSDVSPLSAAIAKLTTSPNPDLRLEAERTLTLLRKP